MCPDPPPRRSPSCWSEGTVRRSCLGGDSLAQGCTAVEPSREGCWRCPVPLRCVSSGVAHLACVREPGTSWAHRCSGCWLPDRRRRCPRADPCQGRGQRHPSLSRGQASTIQASWSCGLRRRVCGAWQVVRLWEAGRCFWLGPLCAVQCRIGHRLSWSERRSGTGATVTLGGDYDRDSEVTVQ